MVARLAGRTVRVGGRTFIRGREPGATQPSRVSVSTPSTTTIEEKKPKVTARVSRLSPTERARILERFPRSKTASEIREAQKVGVEVGVKEVKTTKTVVTPAIGRPREKVRVLEARLTPISGGRAVLGAGERVTPAPTRLGPVETGLGVGGVGLFQPKVAPVPKPRFGPEEGVVEALPIVKEFRAAETGFEAEKKLRIATEQERLVSGLSRFAETRAKQEQVRIAGEPTTKARTRIGVVRGRLRTAVEKGELPLPKAQAELDVLVAREEAGLKALGKEAEIRISGEAIRVAPELVAVGERRIKKFVETETLGVGKITPDVFVAKKSKTLTKIRKRIGKQIEILEVAKGVGPTAKLKDIDTSKLSKVSQKQLKIATKITEFADVVPTQAKIDILSAAEGVIRRPVTVATVGVATVAIGAGIAFAGPIIAAKAAAGSAAAAKTIVGAKVAGAAATTAFVGVSAAGVALAPTRREAFRRVGESVAVGTAAVGGGLIGGAVGGKAFQAALARKPAVTTGKVVQTQIGKDLTVTKIKGITTRKLLGVDIKTGFDTKITAKIKGTKVAQQVITKGEFLGKPLKTISQRLRLTTQEAVGQAGIPSGAGEFVRGTVRVGKRVHKVDFTVFKTGEIVGTIGKRGFRSEITGKPVVKDGVVTFPIKEVSTRLPSGLSKTFAKLFIKKADISKIGIIDVTKPRAIPGPRDITFPRPSVTPTPRPRVIPSARAVTRVTPVTIPGAAALVIPTPTITPLVPAIVRQGAKPISLNIPKITGIVGAPTFPKIGLAAKVGVGEISLPGVETIVRGGVVTAPSVGVDVGVGVGVTPLTGIGFTPPPFTPFTPTFFVPPLPFAIGGGGGGRGRRKGRIPRRTFKFQPSLVAVVKKAVGKTGIPTGVGIRKIPLSMIR